MRQWVWSVLVGVVLLLSTSCATTERGANGGGTPQDVEAAVGPGSSGPALPRAQDRAADVPGQGDDAPGPADERTAEPKPGAPAARVDEVPLTAGRLALTESLEEAARRLAEQKMENRRLNNRVEDLQDELRGKQEQIQQLQAQLKTYDERVREVETSLDRWRGDVLGFREEMRDYHEVQIEVLHTIMNVIRRSIENEEDAR